MIIDGRAIAADILEHVKERLAAIDREIVVRAVVVQPSAVTESYLRTKTKQAEKAGMRMEIVRLDVAATTEEVVAAVEAQGADAVIVQLPLPEDLDAVQILDAIPLTQDADVLSHAAFERFAAGEPDALLPPVTSALREVLILSGQSPSEKSAVVIGSGKLVGQPAALWLTHAGAVVSVIDLDGGDWSLLQEADIVVLGAGSAGLLKPEHIKDGVVILDGGTSESNGSLVGDADPVCAEKSSVFTPVPGGIGPISVACLFQNVAELVLRKSSNGG
jgi:methylenetetrahydrofolate dehydrogenase (NADP+)/methenyltetrahydrofolate cyclohydrolase